MREQRQPSWLRLAGRAAGDFRTGSAGAAPLRAGCAAWARLPGNAETAGEGCAPPGLSMGLFDSLSPPGGGLAAKGGMNDDDFSD